MHTDKKDCNYTYFMKEEISGNVQYFSPIKREIISLIGDDE
jgi:hypothetical protein